MSLPVKLAMDGVKHVVLYLNGTSSVSSSEHEQVGGDSTEGGQCLHKGEGGNISVTAIRQATSPTLFAEGIQFDLEWSL